jgi:Radial spokehead-like protein
MATAPSD